MEKNTNRIERLEEQNHNFSESLSVNAGWQKWTGQEENWKITRAT